MRIVRSAYRILIVIAFLFISSALASQVFLDGKAGLTRNSFFHFKDEKSIQHSTPEWGQYISLGVKHKIQKKLFTTYALAVQRFNSGHSLEKTDGRLSNGYDLSFQVDYLSARLGINQTVFEIGSFQTSVNFSLVLGYQLQNQTSGNVWEFVPVRVIGSDDEDFLIYIREDNSLNNEQYDEIAPYFFGSDVGVEVGFYLSPRILLYAESFYSFTFTPFLEPPSQNILRNVVNLGVGVSVGLVSQ